MYGPLMIAGDVSNRDDLFSLLNQFAPDESLTVKIGMELFYGQGPTIVRDLRQRGCDVFLDLKLHDIPHTVQRAMTQLGRLGVQYTTVHALGGRRMIAAAKAGLVAGAHAAGRPVPKLLAVTELTSVTPAELARDQHCQLSMTDQVVALAQLAQDAGADGVITSPQEVAALRQAVGPDFWYVTPGIRPAGAAADDQARTATPAVAARAGSTALVVGRPILQAAQPVDAYHALLKEWNHAQQ